MYLKCATDNTKDDLCTPLKIIQFSGLKTRGETSGSHSDRLRSSGYCQLLKAWNYLTVNSKFWNFTILVIHRVLHIILQKTRSLWVFSSECTNTHLNKSIIICKLKLNLIASGNVWWNNKTVLSDDLLHWNDLMRLNTHIFWANTTCAEQTLSDSRKSYRDFYIRRKL